jgi:ribosome maturation protein SDO1
MSGIFQPSGQIKLTNVSIVRLKRGGKRFEIACYKNKVVEWRNGVEKDLDNVLQMRTVFINVSKGSLASKDDIRKAFNDISDDEIILEILKKGELQVSSLERASQTSSLLKDIITIITEKTVNPATKRPYTFTIIEKAIEKLHYSIQRNKNAKQQALEIVKQLKEQNILPISRAQMRICIYIPSLKIGKIIKEKLSGLPSLTCVSESFDDDMNEVQIELLIDPGQFRIITDLVIEDAKGKGRVDILSLSEITEGDEGI